jgi:hypothetical protein
MTLNISPKANPNYLAKVVALNNLRPHSNADRLQITTIDGNNVITSLTAKVGDLYVYFPLECAINKDFLAHTNSFIDADLNADKSVKGFFGPKGRVRAIKLRGEKSSGYIVPVDTINSWLVLFNVEHAITDSDVGTEFDNINGILMCQKYVNIEALKSLKNKNQVKGQGKLARVSKLVEGQFAFHVDTMHLAKNSYKIHPDDIIHISKKLHGTSAVASRVLCTRKLSVLEKLVKRLGVKVQETEYQLIWSSRKVIKNGNYYLSWLETFGRNIAYWAKHPGHLVNDISIMLKNPHRTYKNIKGWVGLIKNQSKQNHYYSYDLWEDVANSFADYLTEGLTFYCEVVGFTKIGGEIQKDYDYGCQPNEFKTYIYRITYTNPSGKVFEFSTQQLKEYCQKYGLNYVPELYWGRAKDLFNIEVDKNWHDNFVALLSDTYLEKECDMCVNKVPDEGVVLRREVSEIDPYKLKSFAFKMRETKDADNGVIDMETVESEEVDVDDF